MSLELPEVVEAGMDNDLVVLPLQPTLHPQPLQVGVAADSEKRRALIGWNTPLSEEMTDLLDGVL